MPGDIIYYNININNINPADSGKSEGVYANAIDCNITANNNLPILQNPSDYYGSIIRMSVPLFTVPLIQFLVQTPVTDINKGINTFTLTYGNTKSIKSHYTFYSAVLDFPVPPVGTPQQSFWPYYFIYSYEQWIHIQNTALAVAFADLQAKVGGAIAAAKVPFFYYDSVTELITLYADAAFFDENLPNPIKIYANSVSSQYFNGFDFAETQIGSVDGTDIVFNIRNKKTLNERTIDGTVYIGLMQEFNALCYLSQLRKLVITTNMNVVSEANFINNPDGLQNVAFTNTITDFVPDLSSAGGEAGIGSKIFIYNAPSLYRVFEFMDKQPLYNIPIQIIWQDQLGNIYPLQLAKGTVASLKFMFIKKDKFKQFLL